MKYLFTLVLFIFLSNETMAQKNDYYYNIPLAAKEFTPGTVAGRMVDGLGFRYYWASYGLTQKDLAFQPNKEARTSMQTLDHILGLSTMILYAAKNEPSKGSNTKGLTFAEKRKKTLDNLEEAGKILSAAKDLTNNQIVFKRGDNISRMPFWYVINGPISDALWHVGQVVSFRRSSGNPLPKGVSVLTGKKRD